ncbi:V-type ATP synthase subunit F [Thermosulfuriphilus sp.]
MSGRIFVIADKRTSLAFALAGIDSRPVESPEESQEILQNLSPEVSLVLITESLAEKNRRLIDRLLLKPGGPLILEIPDTNGPHQRSRVTDKIARLLRG